ncbi:MAG: hypothetical protein OXM61_01075 [Candidatus Poribacteria bacterium]|nr:hypothetical protein [Candidatus Poribacteria bacterium]
MNKEKKNKKAEKSRHIPCPDWVLPRHCDVQNVLNVTCNVLNVTCNVLIEGVHREGKAKLNRQYALYQNFTHPSVDFGKEMW